MAAGSPARELEPGADGEGSGALKARRRGSRARSGLAVRVLTFGVPGNRVAGVGMGGRERREGMDLTDKTLTELINGFRGAVMATELAAREADVAASPAEVEGGELDRRRGLVRLQKIFAEVVRRCPGGGDVAIEVDEVDPL